MAGEPKDKGKTKATTTDADGAPPTPESSSGGTPNSALHEEDSISQIDDDEDDRPTPEEAEAVRQLLALPDKDYAKILQLKESYESEQLRQLAALNNASKLLCLTNPGHNLALDSGIAYGKVAKAAKKLKVPDDDLQYAKTWSKGGEDPIPVFKISPNGQFVLVDDNIMDCDVEPNPQQHEQHQLATQYIRKLTYPQEVTAAKAELEKINEEIRKINEGNGLQDKNLFTIDINYYEDCLSLAGVLIDRLRRNANDLEARAELKMIDQELVDKAKKEKYPRDWRIGDDLLSSQNMTPNQGQGTASTQGQTPASTQGQTPASTQGQTPASTQGQTPASTQGQTPASTQGQTPASTQGQNTNPTAGNSASASLENAANALADNARQLRFAIPENTQPVSPSNPTVISSSGHRFRRIVESFDFVTDLGIKKRIEGAFPVGKGYRLLLSYVGNNNLKIFEMVAASTFGTGFGIRYADSSQFQLLKAADRSKIKDKAISQIRIGGVARLRDSDREITQVLFAFEDNLEEMFLIPRSVLGGKFGQQKIDEELIGYMKDAGYPKHRPWPARRSGRRSRPRSRSGSRSGSRSESHPRSRSARSNYTRATSPSGESAYSL